MAVLVSGGLGVLVGRAGEVLEFEYQVPNWVLVQLNNPPYMSWGALVLLRISQICSRTRNNP